MYMINSCIIYINIVILFKYRDILPPIRGRKNIETRFYDLSFLGLLEVYSIVNFRIRVID